MTKLTKEILGKIQKLRAEGKTQNEIAEIVGYNQSTISNWLIKNGLRTQAKPKKTKKQKFDRNWGKPHYVKVLIQEFEGAELIKPNEHNSKFLALYNTTPSEVYDLIISLLRKAGKI